MPGSRYEKTVSTQQSLRRVWLAFHLAQPVGRLLGTSALLFRTLPPLTPHVTLTRYPLCPTRAAGPADDSFPGTIECDSASPINDQPLSIRKQDRNAHTPPTSIDTHIALRI